MPTFFGKIELAAITWDWNDQIRAFLTSPKWQGKEVEVTIELRGKDPTAEQRGYYFAVVLAAAEDLGYLKDELDDALRRHHSPQVEGKRHNYRKALSKLNRQEYSRYIDDCIITLAKAGYAVEPPNRNWNKTGWYQTPEIKNQDKSTKPK